MEGASAQGSPFSFGNVLSAQGSITGRECFAACIWACARHARSKLAGVGLSLRDSVHSVHQHSTRDPLQVSVKFQKMQEWGRRFCASLEEPTTVCGEPSSEDEDSSSLRSAQIQCFILDWTTVCTLLSGLVAGPHKAAGQSYAGMVCPGRQRHSMHTADVASERLQLAGPGRGVLALALPNQWSCLVAGWPGGSSISEASAARFWNSCKQGAPSTAPVPATGSKCVGFAMLLPLFGCFGLRLLPCSQVEQRGEGNLLAAVAQLGFAGRGSLAVRLQLGYPWRPGASCAGPRECGLC